jgi:hypothetical protein
MAKYVCKQNFWMCETKFPREALQAVSSPLLFESRASSFRALWICCLLYQRATMQTVKDGPCNCVTSKMFPHRIGKCTFQRTSSLNAVSNFRNLVNQADLSAFTGATKSPPPTEKKSASPGFFTEATVCSPPSQRAALARNGKVQRAEAELAPPEVVAFAAALPEEYDAYNEHQEPSAVVPNVPYPEQDNVYSEQQEPGTVTSILENSNVGAPYDTLPMGDDSQQMDPVIDPSAVGRGDASVIWNGSGEHGLVNPLVTGDMVEVRSGTSLIDLAETAPGAPMEGLSASQLDDPVRTGDMVEVASVASPTVTTGATSTTVPSPVEHRPANPLATGDMVEVRSVTSLYDLVDDTTVPVLPVRSTANPLSTADMVEVRSEASVSPSHSTPLIPSDPIATWGLVEPQSATSEGDPGDEQVHSPIQRDSFAPAKLLATGDMVEVRSTAALDTLADEVTIAPVRSVHSNAGAGDPLTSGDTAESLNAPLVGAPLDATARFAVLSVPYEHVPADPVSTGDMVDVDSTAAASPVAPPLAVAYATPSPTSPVTPQRAAASPADPYVIVPEVVSPQRTDATGMASKRHGTEDLNAPCRCVTSKMFPHRVGKCSLRVQNNTRSAPALVPASQVDARAAVGSPERHGAADQELVSLGAHSQATTNTHTASASPQRSPQRSTQPSSPHLASVPANVADQERSASPTPARDDSDPPCRCASSKMFPHRASKCKLKQTSNKVKGAARSVSQGASSLAAPMTKLRRKRTASKNRTQLQATAEETHILFRVPASQALPVYLKMLCINAAFVLTLVGLLVLGLGATSAVIQLVLRLVRMVLIRK